MKYLLGVILAPVTFAIAFLWPLATQSGVALGLVEPGWSAVLMGAAIALPFGLLAQFRGSWVWIK